MAGYMKQGKCKLPKASGSRSSTGGFKKVGKLKVIESPAASTDPDFSKGGKRKGGKGMY